MQYPCKYHDQFSKCIYPLSKYCKLDNLSINQMSQYTYFSNHKSFPNIAHMLVTTCMIYYQNLQSHKEDMSHIYPHSRIHQLHRKVYPYIFHSHLPRYTLIYLQALVFGILDIPRIALMIVHISVTSNRMHFLYSYQIYKLVYICY